MPPILSTLRQKATTFPSPLHTHLRRISTQASRRTWSYQHYKIRQPRPLVDRFSMFRCHQEKQWWRERRVAPATFMGFPDITKADLRGGSIYCEKMDGVTLAVIADKCVQEQLFEPMLWERFCWRSKQLVTKVQEPEVCYLFKAFGQADYWESNWFAAYTGRIEKRLPYLNISHLCTVLEGCIGSSSRFWHQPFVERILSQFSELLHGRDDLELDDLCRSAPLLWNVGNFYLLRLVCERLSERAVEDLTLENQILLLEVVSQVYEQVQGKGSGQTGIEGSRPPECFSILKDSLVKSLYDLLDLHHSTTAAKDLQPKYLVPITRALVSLRQSCGGSNSSGNLISSSSSNNTGTTDILGRTALEELIETKLRQRVKDTAYKMTIAGITECAYLLKGLDFSPLISSRCKSMKCLDLARFSYICSTDKCYQELKRVFIDRVGKFNVQELGLMYGAFVVRGDSVSGAESSSNSETLSLSTSFSNFLRIRRGRKLLSTLDRDQLAQPIDYAEEALLNSSKDAKLLGLPLLSETGGVQLISVEKEDPIVAVLEKFLLEKIVAGEGSGTGDQSTNNSLGGDTINSTTEQLSLLDLSKICKHAAGLTLPINNGNAGSTDSINTVTDAKRNFLKQVLERGEKKVLEKFKEFETRRDNEVKEIEEEEKRQQRVGNKGQQAVFGSTQSSSGPAAPKSHALLNIPDLISHQSHH